MVIVAAETKRDREEGDVSWVQLFMLPTDPVEIDLWVFGVTDPK